MDKSVENAIDRAIFYTTNYGVTADVLYKEGEASIVCMSPAGTEKKLREGWEVVAAYKGGVPVSKPAAV